MQAEQSEFHALTVDHGAVESSQAELGLAFHGFAELLGIMLNDQGRFFLEIYPAAVDHCSPGMWSDRD